MAFPIEAKAFCISVMNDVKAPLIMLPMDAKALPIEAKAFWIDLTNPLKKLVIDEVM